MIGKKVCTSCLSPSIRQKLTLDAQVADAVLSGEFRRLAFYRYDSNLKQLVDDFKASINSVALDWTREEKEMALAQSVESFKVRRPLLHILYENHLQCVGTIMKTMFKEDDEM